MSRHITLCHVGRFVACTGWLAIAVMASLDSSDTESTSGSDAESSSGGNTDPWESRDAQLINAHSVILQRELDVSKSQANRELAFINR